MSAGRCRAMSRDAGAPDDGLGAGRPGRGHAAAPVPLPQRPALLGLRLRRRRARAGDAGRRDGRSRAPERLPERATLLQPPPDWSPCWTRSSASTPAARARRCSGARGRRPTCAVAAGGCPATRRSSSAHLRSRAARRAPKADDRAGDGRGRAGRLGAGRHRGLPHAGAVAGSAGRHGRAGAAQRRPAWLLVWPARRPAGPL